MKDAPCVRTCSSADSRPGRSRPASSYTRSRSSAAVPLPSSRSTLRATNGYACRVLLVLVLVLQGRAQQAGQGVRQQRRACVRCSSLASRRAWAERRRDAACQATHLRNHLVVRVRGERDSFQRCNTARQNRHVRRHCERDLQRRGQQVLRQRLRATQVVQSRHCNTGVARQATEPVSERR